MAYENARPWDKRNVEKIKEIKRNWNKRNPGKKKEIARDWQSRPEVRKHLLEYGKEYRQRVRREVLGLYGGKCECCGETEVDFLGIDHKDGGGKKDIKSRGVGEGYSWYLYLRRNHPGHVRVLCYNCNFSRGHYGSCPHERKKNEILS